MTVQDWVTIIGAIFLGLAQLLTIYLNHRANNQTNKKLAETVGKVEEVHAATNGLKDELVAATAREAHARGIRDGLERVKEITDLARIDREKDARENG